MVTHIICWKLKDQALGHTKLENAQEMKRRLEALVGVVPGLLEAHVGINFNEKNTYDVSLYSLLEDRQALAVYQDHPAHVQVKEFVHRVIEDRACVDSE